jgi:GTP cyclohydrolase I
MNKKKIEELIKAFLEEIGYDTEQDAFRRTPERVASFIEELQEDTRKDFRKEFRTYRTETRNDIIILREIPFFSFCEHHMLPFFGHVHIAYKPKNGIVGGFSHFVTLLNCLSRRLQLQERLGEEIADALMEVLDPEGVLVVIEARHLCIEMRGEKPIGTKAITVSARGILEALKEKSNALSLMGIKG